jgi:predicted transcriptional regulator
MSSDGASVTLKQADVDLLVAVCKQLGKVDTKQLAEDLGINTSAAGMRWKRFRDRTFGDKKEAEAEGGFHVSIHVHILSSVHKDFSLLSCSAPFHLSTTSYL